MAGCVPTFKLVLAGNPGVGRHTFMHQFIESQFNVQMSSTGNVNANIYPLTLNTTIGPVRFDVWVSNEQPVSSSEGNGNGEQQQNLNEGGRESLPAIPDSFYDRAQCAIIMFDVTSRQTYKEVPNYFRDVVRINDCIPVVLVGNKNDLFDERQVKPKMITFHRKKRLMYYDISAKAQKNVVEPFVWLLRKLTENPSLDLNSQPDLVAADVDASLHEEAYDELAKQLKTADDLYSREVDLGW